LTEEVFKAPTLALLNKRFGRASAHIQGLRMTFDRVGNVGPREDD
jgi:hypothetical protein